MNSSLLFFRFMLWIFLISVNSLTLFFFLIYFIISFFAIALIQVWLFLLIINTSIFLPPCSITFLIPYFLSAILCLIIYKSFGFITCCHIVEIFCCFVSLIVWSSLILRRMIFSFVSKYIFSWVSGFKILSCHWIIYLLECLIHLDYLTSFRSLFALSIL